MLSATHPASGDVVSPSEQRLGASQPAAHDRPVADDRRRTCRRASAPRGPRRPGRRSPGGRRRRAPNPRSPVGSRARGRTPGPGPRSRRPMPDQPVRSRRRDGRRPRRPPAAPPGPPQPAPTDGTTLECSHERSVTLVPTPQSHPPAPTPGSGDTSEFARPVPRTTRQFTTSSIAPVLAHSAVRIAMSDPRRPITVSSGPSAAPRKCRFSTRAFVRQAVARTARMGPTFRCPYLGTVVSNVRRW